MTQLSKEYAESLFSLALEDSKEEEYLSEIRFVLGLIEKEPDYAELLSSPALSREERIEALKSALGDGFSEYVMSFLSVLCETGHMKMLPDCVAEYERMYRDASKTAAVKVTSAAPLDEDARRKIADKVHKIVGGKCEITYLVDPSLIGGAIIETENAVIDGSIRKTLQDIKGVIKK